MGGYHQEIMVNKWYYISIVIRLPVKWDVLYTPLLYYFVSLLSEFLLEDLHGGRKPYFPCDTAGVRRQNCRNRDLIYESCCHTFNPFSLQEETTEAAQPKVGKYVGETSHSLHERAEEHINDAVTFNLKSHIVKCWMLSHPETNSPPKMALANLVATKARATNSSQCHFLLLKPWRINKQNPAIVQVKMATWRKITFSLSFL